MSTPESTEDPAQQVSKEQLTQSLPKNMRQRISDDFVDLYNAAVTDTDSDLVHVFKENFITYNKILEGSKYSINNYLMAVKYVSFKLMGFTNRESYKMTFPERSDRIFKKYRDLGFDDQYIWDYKISPHVVSYNKNNLVNDIIEQSIIPPHVLNLGMYQEALNASAHLMVHAKSEMVRAQAANNILTQLKPPETAKVELDIKIGESDAIESLRKVTQELAAQQQLAIKSGVVTSLEVAESIIVEAIEIEEKDES